MDGPFNPTCNTQPACNPASQPSPQFSLRVFIIYRFRSSKPRAFIQSETRCGQEVTTSFVGRKP